MHTSQIKQTIQNTVEQHYPVSIASHDNRYTTIQYDRTV